VSKLKARDFVPREAIQCAHAGCPDDAILRRQLPTGTAFLCKRHDLFHVQQEANEFCWANGLSPRGKQMEFIRAKLGASRLFKRLPRQIFREPGEDDEVISA